MAKWGTVNLPSKNGRYLVTIELNVPRTLVTLVMSKWHDNN